MAALTGDDQSWKAGGYGALGSATPRTEQGGNAPVDSYGVWGLLGTPADINSAVAHLTTPQEFVVGAPLRGAIVARNTLPDEGVAIFGESRPLDATTSTASGFIAGRSPFAGEATGVFGEATERGVIGIASTPGGIGVYGGSVNGVASSGVFGDAGDSIGVTGRANSALGPGTAPGGFADPNIRAGVLGENGGHGYGVKGTSQTTGVLGQGETGVAALGSGPAGMGILAIGNATGVDAAGGTRGVRASATNGAGLEALAVETGVGLYAHSADPEGGIATLGVQNTLSNDNGVVACGKTNGVFGLSLHGTAVGGLVVDGIAVAGRTQGTTASAIGVIGVAPTANNSQALAGRFDGNVDVRGALQKSGGGFRIDHPLEPTEKSLNHSFVESAERTNLYDGVAVLDESGRATIELPEWFQAINSDFRYQLTCIGEFAPVYIAEKITEHHFAIAGGQPGMEVCWQVTGRRSDKWAIANPVHVEEPKQSTERGCYRHPELYRDEKRQDDG